MATFVYPPAPADAVTSVNGQTGVVVLTATSVGAANTTLSNLGVTALAMDLNPAASGTVNLGVANTQVFNSLYVANIWSADAQVSIDTTGVLKAGSNRSVFWLNRTLYDSADGIAVDWATSGAIKFSAYGAGVLNTNGSGVISATAGGSGSFITVDAKTVTVVGGIITSIV